MQFIQGYNRNQTTFSTLDDRVEADNPVEPQKIPCSNAGLLFKDVVTLLTHFQTCPSFQ
jgi:hypothetical protein